MKLRRQVQSWDSKVEANERIIDGPRQFCLGVAGCFPRRCKPNYMLTERVAEQPHKVTKIPPSQEVTKIPRSQMEGRQLVLDLIRRGLMDLQVRIVALCGIGGVGKTFILQKINKFLNIVNDFDVVIWITVSKDMRVDKIQQDIWSRLGFYDENLMNIDFEQKAADIHNALTEKKFLLLLDDVWQRLDLAEIGIPCLDKQNGSKIVFTTRFDRVCSQMKADLRLEIQPLERQQAWDLFVRNVGKDVIKSLWHQHVLPLAEAAVNECFGVPFALITVARAMATKYTFDEWMWAIKVLRKSSSKFPGMENIVFPILQFRNGHVPFPSRIIKSCFSYCVFFPKDFKILKDDLIDCWIGENFLRDYNNGAYREGYHIISVLTDAGLLQDGGKYVTVTGSVRNMAFSMASKDKNILVEASAQLIKPPTVETWRSRRKMSLMSNSIRKLKKVPKCRHLSTLFLSYNPYLTTITDGFFQYMEVLTVLDLSNSNIQELPKGISNLVTLQYLNLSHTWIEELPLELKKLVKLQCLNLEHNDLLRVIPREVISNLLSLQVLKIFRCDVSLIEADNNILSYINKHVEELRHLKDLNALSITITCQSALRSLLNIPKLQSCIRALSLRCFWGSKSLNIMLFANMKHLEKLEICRTDHLKELNFDLTMQVEVEGAEIQEFCTGLHSSKTSRLRSFDNLQELVVRKCHLRDLTWLVLAPNLSVLKVIDCREMEVIIDIRKLHYEVVNEDEYQNPFAKLEVLVLEQLPELRSIHWKALPFPCLKEVKVLDCPMLKSLPSNGTCT